MGLSNLPPGCRDSDIPGNRPQDTAAEAFYEALDDKCRELNCKYPDERLVDWIWEQIESRGY